MDNRKRGIIPSQGGMWRELLVRLKLIWRLLGDRRVNFFLKLLPIAAAIYLVIPFDLAPGLALPVIGVLDDAAVLWLGGTLFLELCPPGVVKEHVDDLGGEGSLPGQVRDNGDVVDGQARDVTDEQNN